jgi:sugar PTS system EIIA component
VSVLSPVSGTSRDISDVPDPVFATGVVGPGVALDPVREVQTAVSPIPGRVAKLHAHAYLVVGDGGLGVLVHLGIDTARMRGDGFTVLVGEDDVLGAGQDVVVWDPAYVERSGRSPVCAVVLLDRSSPVEPLQVPGSRVRIGQPLFEVDC